MKPPKRPPILYKAVKISLSLNSAMVVTGVLSNMFTRLSWLSLISTIIAWPPATLIGWMLKPKTGSLTAVAFAGVEGLFCSIVFYFVVAWLALRYWPQLSQRWRENSRKKSESNP